MKYKNDYINKLESALNLAETLQKAIESNGPLTKEEILYISKNIQKILNFVLERIELESD